MEDDGAEHKGRGEYKTNTSTARTRTAKTPTNDTATTTTKSTSLLGPKPAAGWPAK